MNHQLAAVTLLQNHQQKVAQSVARQMLRSIPRYEEMGEEMLRRSTNQLVEALIKYLDTGNAEPLQKLCVDMIALRRIGGFSSSELLMAGMCFFPVLRRFFIRKAERTRIGLDLYDEVEQKLFPIFVNMAMYMEQETQSSRQDELGDLTFSNLGDFQFEEVGDEQGVIGGTPFDPASS